MMAEIRRLALVGSIALSLGVADAVAHSQKQGTVPQDGAVLAAAPEQISMAFDMPMRVTTIKLIDAQGGEHGLTRTDNMKPVTTFVATPETLAPGSYTVEWRGLADDGHAMSGTFSFEVKD